MTGLLSIPMVPFVSIIVTVKNEESYISNLFTSMASLDYPKDRVETIVVDGGSTDRTISIVSSYSWIKLITSQCSHSEGINIGVKNARGEIIACTDGDCILDKDWLKNIVKHFEANPIIGAVGGPYLPSKQKELFAETFAYYSQSWFPRTTGYTMNPFKLGTGNVAFRRRLFDEIGWFDESIGMGTSKIKGGNDNDFNFRIMDAGYKLFFADDVVIFHKFRGFRDNSGEEFRRGIYSTRYYKQEHAHVSAMWRLRNFLIPFLFPAFSLLLILNLLTGRFTLAYIQLFCILGYYFYRIMRFRINRRAKPALIPRLLEPIIAIYVRLLWSFGALIGLVI